MVHQGGAGKEVWLVVRLHRGWSGHAGLVDTEWDTKLVEEGGRGWALATKTGVVECGEVQMRGGEGHQWQDTV